MAVATVADYQGALVSFRQARELRLQRPTTLSRQAAESHAMDVGAMQWEPWLRGLFPKYVSNARSEPVPFGAHHARFWDWVWALERGTRPRPFVAIWPRGGGKSTAAELAVVAAGARETRRYALYVGGSQDRADDHVTNIGSLLESPAFGEHYPRMASRKVSKYGTSKGWRRNRLWTATGFVVDALGLDTAARGVKIEEARPDLIVLDDVDNGADSVKVTAKKIATITRGLLPAGSSDLAVLGTQNLIHPNGIFARLADRRADFLQDRIVSGPYAALEGMTYDQREDGTYRITAGRPIWPGQDLAACQSLMDSIGLSSFLAEVQQEVDAPPGGIWDHLQFKHCDWNEIPDLVDIEVWVDPAVEETDGSDCHAIQADGITESGQIYRLYSWEDRTSPEDSMMRAIRKAVELHASAVGVETNQGGQTWRSVYREAARAEGVENPPRFKAAKATTSKVERNGRMLAAYERGQVTHVRGTHTTLERALRRFPGTKPFDLVDASFWAWYSLWRRHYGTGAAVGAIPVSMERESPWI